MLDIQHNIALNTVNTLAIAAKARFYVDITSEAQVPAVMAFARQQQLPILILGGGSNIVLTGDFLGLVINIALRGVEFTLPLTAGNSLVRVNAAAGENWGTLVRSCLENKFYGLENLSLIPGSVGAAPIQNIGAYGVELKQRFESLRGWDCKRGCWRTLTAKDCDFSYRDSVFKQQLKDCFIITSVCLNLRLTPQPETSYPALREELNKRGFNTHSGCDTSAEHIAEAVIAIRKSKLPDPNKTPNVGSFFKNPTLNQQQFAAVKEKYPAIVSYPQQDGRIKVAAGWLLEQAGWKGKTHGAVGMHSAQSLVLVNNGGATGTDVINLATDIQRDIQQRFGLHLEIEPAVY